MTMKITRRGLTKGAVALAAAATPIATACTAQTKPSAIVDTIVLGAGMSGLQTAWQLEQEGQKVLVLEGRQRVGGRVYTLLDQPGYPEMGFNSMGQGYGRGIDAAQRAGVELVDVLPRFMKTGPTQVVIGTKVMNREEWAKSPSNPFPDQMKMVLPGEITGKLVKDNNPLKDWADWLEPSSAPLDISLHDFLKSKGLSDAAIKLAFDTSPYYGTTSEDVSALMFEFSDKWQQTQNAAGPSQYAVKGGNMRLPQGMAKLLKGDLLFGKAVVAISSESDAATVRCADGTVYRAKSVVCSLPLSTLRKIKIEPGVTGKQADAFQNIPYQPISVAFVKVKEPFWEKDKLAPAMWTDGLLGNVIPQHFGDNLDDVSGLMIQARGALAHQWDKLGADGVKAAIISQMEAVRPASKGLIEPVHIHSWTQEPFNLGDWAYFKPGQLSTIYKDAATPLAGRIYFCGEHTAQSNRGLEGALESAERVSLEVLGA